MSKTKEVLSYALEGTPTSADPFDFDLIDHHVTFGSTLSPLITNYTKGKHTGLISDSWSVSPDQKTWRFHIRSDITFEDGTPITPSIVAKSIHRIANLIKSRNSKTGIVEYLDGFNTLTSHQDIPGIKYDVANVTLSFTKSQPDLLDGLSFGMYSIVNPKNFDSSTLKWTAGITPIASGPYRIKSHDNNATSLELRKDYPSDLYNIKPFEKIQIIWGKGKALESDLFTASSTFPKSENFKFYASGLRDIYYVKAFSWKSPQSPVHSLEMRKKLRDQFFKSYTAKGFNPPEWFFPSFSGTESCLAPDTSTQVPQTSRQIKYSRMDGKAKRLVALNESFDEMARSAGLLPVAVPQNLSVARSEGHDSSALTFSYDLLVQGTQIRIDNPDDSIRFMFRSSEGVRLPDTDGRIEEELKKEPLDIKKLNCIIKEQAAIWPTMHPETGYYSKKSSKIDLSQLNLSAPPIQFQWIGHN